MATPWGWHVLAETAPMWMAAGAAAVGALFGRLLRPKVPARKLDELPAVMKGTPRVPISSVAEGATVKLEGRVVKREDGALWLADESGRAHVPFKAGPSVLLHIVVPLAESTKVAVVGTAHWITGESGYRDLDRWVELRPEPTIWLSTDPAFVEAAP